MIQFFLGSTHSFLGILPRKRKIVIARSFSLLEKSSVISCQQEGQVHVCLPTKERLSDFQGNKVSSDLK